MAELRLSQGLEDAENLIYFLIYTKHIFYL